MLLQTKALAYKLQSSLTCCSFNCPLKYDMSAQSNPNGVVNDQALSRLAVIIPCIDDFNDDYV